MHRNIRKSVPLVCIVAAVALTACDVPERLSAADDETAASFSRGAAGRGAGALRPAWAKAGRFGGANGAGTIDMTGQALFVDVDVPLDGGTRAGRHTLYVPARAVAQPTHFTMTGMEESFAWVVLSATSARPGSSQNDVGTRGFRVPLTLCLDGMDAVYGENKLVAFFTKGGTAVPLKATADPDAASYPNRVCGEVRHFSGYIIAAN
jgi:hypothetical protein